MDKKREERLEKVVAEINYEIDRISALIQQAKLKGNTHTAELYKSELDRKCGELDGFMRCYEIMTN